MKVNSFVSAMLAIRSDKDIQNAALSDDTLKTMIAQRTGNGDALSTMRTTLDSTDSNFNS